MMRRRIVSCKDKFPRFTTDKTADNHSISSVRSSVSSILTPSPQGGGGGGKPPPYVSGTILHRAPRLPLTRELSERMRGLRKRRSKNRVFRHKRFYNDVLLPLRLSPFGEIHLPSQGEAWGALYGGSLLPPRKKGYRRSNTLSQSGRACLDRSSIPTGRA